jgi:hypothetical protein
LNINKLTLGRAARFTAAAVTAVAFAFTAGGTATAQPAAQTQGTVTATTANAATLQQALKGLTPVSTAQLQSILGQGGSKAGSHALGFNGVYDHIINDNSGQCLAVPGGSTANGTGLIQWPCGSWNDHYWSAYYQFNAYNFNWYHVVNYNSGQCLAVPGASTANGTQVIQWPCGNYADHYWAFGTDSTGKMHIINYNSGQCLAIPGASTANGAHVIQWPCGTWPDHYWH